MKIRNISDGKIIGFGEVSVLPNETIEVPNEFVENPSVKLYEKLDFIIILDDGKKAEKIEDVMPKPIEEEPTEEDSKALREARLASLNVMSDESLANLALELGIGLETCKSKADMKKKIRTALTAE